MQAAPRAVDNAIGVVSGTLAGRLAEERRWVAWRNEPRGAKGKITKVPYGARGKRAKADDPSTWLNRTEAETLSQKLINGKDSGGIGYQLGEHLGDLHLSGLDLDSCRNADGSLAQWAQAIVDVVPSYGEISPSGGGIKLFFYITSEDVRRFLDRIGVDSRAWGTRRSVGENSADPGPAIEVYAAGRYFAVTGNLWPGAPDTLALLDWPTLERLVPLIPPAKRNHKGVSAVGDDSRSAKAFRKGAALRRAAKSFEEMCDALRRDPDTGDWVREKGDSANGRELRRIWDKAAPADEATRTIRVLAGERPKAADEGLAAMQAAGIPFYVRDRRIVQVCHTKAKSSDGKIVDVPAIVPVELPILSRALGQSARWERLNAKGNVSRIDPPKEVVEQIAGMIEEWPFPPLAGVIGTPSLRPDGCLLATEGYDPQTGFVLLNPPPMPPIPELPTRADAEAAIALLKGLLTEFPFANEASHSVAISMLITPVVRPALPPAVPLHVVTAPESGTGKSYLLDIASAIAVGDRCAVMAMSKPEETEKRLIGAALAGHPIIALDNCSTLLLGDFLCQVTERPLLLLRPLGTSKEVRVTNTFTTFADGNNLPVGADVVRRTLQCALDADMEDPGDRQFLNNPVDMVLTHRGEYIAACLTIVRAYIVAGLPQRLPRVPSFEKWSDLVRSSLVWLGYPDPVETTKIVRSEDPLRQARDALYSAWATDIGLMHAHQTADLISMANTRPDFRDALLAVACASSAPTRVDPTKLGYWLRGNANAVAAGLKLHVDRSDKKRPKWQLKPMSRKEQR